MRAPFRSILLCVLGGTGTTVVLAWALALARPWPRESPGLFQIDGAGDAWMGFGPQGLGWRAATLYGATSLTAAARSSADAIPRWVIATTDQQPVESRAIGTFGSGWPMTALRARRTGVGHDEPPPGSSAWHTGLGPQWVEWRDWEGALAADGDETATDAGARLLPIGVYPAGLAVDVLVWSAIWSLLPLTFAARRAVRRRRGACVRCGYDLRGGDSSNCPECGMSRGA